MALKRKRAALTKAEREEFDQIFEKYNKTIYRAALRMTGDTDAADDIRQDTFETFLSKMDEAHKADSIGGWLLGVMELEVLHYQRKWARRLQREVELEACEDVPAPPYETREDFLHCLPDWVDERDRKILLWYYYDGYSLGDIAPWVGLTYKSLRVHMSRLFVKLRESGTDWYQQE